MSDEHVPDMGGAVCNITKRGKSRRLGLGIVVLAGTLAAVAWLDGSFGSPWWRAGAIPFLFFGFLCCIQAQENT